MAKPKWPVPPPDSRLTVIEPTSARGHKGEVVWLCRCECGRMTRVGSQHLSSGNTMSCGCLRLEAAGGSARIAAGTANLKAAHARESAGLCRGCQRPFAAKGRQVYCSAECRGTATRPPGDTPCGNCGRMIDAFGFRGRYCSPACRRNGRSVQEYFRRHPDESLARIAGRLEDLLDDHTETDDTGADPDAAGHPDD